MFVLFTRLLNMSLTASLLVFAVILLRLCFKKAPKRFICILWALVALRLICPVSISSSLSAFNLFKHEINSKGQVEYFQYNGKTENPAINFTVPTIGNDNSETDIAIDEIDSDVADEDDISNETVFETKTSSIYLPNLVYLWLIGLASMLVYAGAGYWKLRKEIGASISNGNNIFVCDEITTPFIFGVFRPGIYLPSGLEEKVKNNVIAHEQAHLKRLDHIWKPLGYLLLSIHWFNPVMWVAYLLLCRDIEAACDERVIEEMDKESIADYSSALLFCAQQRRLITACPVAFGETDVKGRVKNILNYKKPAFWIICLAPVACVAVAVCFLTNPKAATEELLKNASPETSAMTFYYFDGESTEVKWLYDETEEKYLIAEINGLDAKKVENSRIAEMSVPCYGLEISDKDGYEIWLTYSNGLWLSKDGSVYEANYNFQKVYSDLPSDDMDIFKGGSAMVNSGLLGEYDIRFYTQAEPMSSEKNGISLSVVSIDMKKNKVTVCLTNNSGQEFGYGAYYSLQKEIDGIWYELPAKLSNYAFIDLGYILPAGESREEECDLTMYGKLEEGANYRIEKEGLVAQFGSYVLEKYLEENPLPEPEEPIINDAAEENSASGEEPANIKWDDFGFDCWPLAGGGKLRDEWSEETPFWQFTADLGTEVYAVKDGYASGGYNYDDGNYVELRLNDEKNTVVKYSHLDEQYYDDAQLVTAGTTIGTVGATGKATGPFLKVEININSNLRRITESQIIVGSFKCGEESGMIVASITEAAIRGTGVIELVVRNASGKDIWSTELGTPHMGWNSYYLYAADGKDYLIEYNPNESQGMIYYTFRMFSLDENGNETVIVEYYAEDAEEIPKFNDKIEPYMSNAELIISTLNGVITS